MNEYRLEDIQSNDRVVSSFTGDEEYRVISHWDDGVIIQLNEERGWSFSERRIMDDMKKIQEQAISRGFITKEESAMKVFWYVSIHHIERVIKNKTIKWID